MMNPRERLLAAIRGERVDRVPLVMTGFHFESLDEVRDPGKREILERVHDQLHFFHSCPSFINRYLVTPPQRIKEIDREERKREVTVTMEIDTPGGPLTSVTSQNRSVETMWTLKYPVESLEDIEKIRSVPWELPPALAPPDVSCLPSSFETRGILHTGISSPFVCVAGMMSYQYFLELCATEPNLMKELSAQCLERITDILDVLLSGRSIEYVWMGGSEWVTPPMGSPELYETLVHVFEKPLIEKIHAGGAVSHIHCHGNVRSTLEMVIERGGDFFEPVEPPPDGDISFAEAKALASGRMTLGGNIEFRILQNESPNMVEDITRHAFDNGTHRMVLQPSDGPLTTMDSRLINNYDRMIDVWEELSLVE